MNLTSRSCLAMLALMFLAMLFVVVMGNWLADKVFIEPDNLYLPTLTPGGPLVQGIPDEPDISYPAWCTMFYCNDWNELEKDQFDRWMNRHYFRWFFSSPGLSPYLTA